MSGCLWLAFAVTGDPECGIRAREVAERIAGREDDDSTHDLGFLFYPSHVVGAMVDRDDRLRTRALRAATQVAARFVGGGGYIQAWGPRHHPEWVETSTIDTMMNLPLLWWAARESGDRRYFDIAATHARTTHRHFFRSDGSTYHLVRFDSESGQPRVKTTYQGYSADSCWSRGQAWAIASFATSFRETGDPEDLRAAESAVMYFLQRLPSDHVPFWDFDDPAVPRAPRDSSAAAIAACGLLELASSHPNAERREHFRAAAGELLGALAEHCENREPQKVAGLLLHGCYSRPQGQGIDSALIWGDYFYMCGRLWHALGLRPETMTFAGRAQRSSGGSAR